MKWEDSPFEVIFGYGTISYGEVLCRFGNCVD